MSAHQRQITFFTLWIDILQELLPSSLLEQFQQKEDEYLWIQEILTEQELIVDSTDCLLYTSDAADEL